MPPGATGAMVLVGKAGAVLDGISVAPGGAHEVGSPMGRQHPVRF